MVRVPVAKKFAWVRNVAYGPPKSGGFRKPSNAPGNPTVNVIVGSATVVESPKAATDSVPPYELMEPLPEIDPSPPAGEVDGGAAAESAAGAGASALAVMGILPPNEA